MFYYIDLASIISSIILVLMSIVGYHRDIKLKSRFTWIFVTTIIIFTVTLSASVSHKLNSLNQDKISIICNSTPSVNP